LSYGLSRDEEYVLGNLNEEKPESNMLWNEDENVALTSLVERGLAVRCDFTLDWDETIPREDYPF
jgi:hypothetical protein